MILIPSNLLLIISFWPTLKKFEIYDNHTTNFPFCLRWGMFGFLNYTYKLNFIPDLRTPFWTRRPVCSSCSAWPAIPDVLSRPSRPVSRPSPASAPPSGPNNNRSAVCQSPSAALFWKNSSLLQCKWTNSIQNKVKFKWPLS